MADVVLRAELDRAGLAGLVEVDSAGTGDWHVGEPMDGQAEAELARHGYDGSAHRARQIQPSWLGQCDLVLAMDRSNLADLRAPGARRRGGRAGLLLFRSFDPDLAAAKAHDPFDGDVPDPYGGRPATRSPGSGPWRRTGPGRTAGRVGPCRRPERDHARGRRACGRPPAGHGTGDPAARDREPAPGPKLARRVPAGPAAGADHRHRGARHPRGRVAAPGAHYHATLADGRVVFVKAARGPGQRLEAEARGLRWLAERARGAGARRARLGRRRRWP